jgi:hypothetical protein
MHKSFDIYKNNEEGKAIAIQDLKDSNCFLVATIGEQGVAVRFSDLNNLQLKSIIDAVNKHMQVLFEMHQASEAAKKLLDENRKN